MSDFRANIARLTASFVSAWDRFFFAPADLYNVSLFRCLFGIAIFFMYFQRDQAAGLFFLNNGLVPVSQALHVLPDGYRPIIPFFLHTDFGIRLQIIAQLVLIALFAVGAFGRSLTWLLFFVTLGLNQRDFSIVYGADLFADFWLFYFCFIDHNRHFSIWNPILPGRRRAQASRDMNVKASDIFSSMGIRLMQIQLCLSYAYTGFEKLKGTTWWSGTAIWYVIGMQNLIPHDFGFMKHFPILIGVSTMATVVFEVYFIFAVWSRRLRYPWLIAGFFFHLATAVFMGLWYFFFVMVTPYLLFLPNIRDNIQRHFARGGA